MRKIARRTIAGFFALTMLFCIFATVVPARTAAFTVASNAPQNGLSQPTGGHVFNMRKRPELGKALDVLLTVYMPKTTTAKQWNDGYIEISSTGQNVSTDDICSVPDPRGADVRNFITVTASNTVSPFDERQYQISKNSVCKEKSNGGENARNYHVNNKLYARYPLPNFPGRTNLDNQSEDYGVDSQTDMFKVELRIEYSPSAPADAGHAAFKVLASSLPGSKISQGSGDLSFPIIGKNNLNDPDTVIDVPFALPCSNGDPNEVVSQTIKLYDADNGNRAFPRAVKLRVYKLYDAARGIEYEHTPDARHLPPVDLKNGQFGDIIRGTNFIPHDGGTIRASVDIDMKRNDAYIVRVFDLHSGNTVDIGIPGKSIFADSKVCKHWNIEGDSKVGPSSCTGGGQTYTVQRGSQVCFWHELKNIQADRTDPFDYSVQWTEHAVDPTPLPRQVNATSFGNDRQLAGYATLRYSRADPGLRQPFTIPDGANPGDRFCQRITWTPDSSYSTAGSSSSQACVTVAGSFDVTLETIVCINGVCTDGDPKVEAGSTYVRRSYVKVKNFPIHRVGYQTFMNGDVENASGGCKFGNQNGNAAGDGRCYVPARFSLQCVQDGVASTHVAIFDLNGSDDKFCDTGNETVVADNIGARQCNSLTARPVGGPRNWYESPNLFSQPNGNRFVEPGLRINYDNGNRQRISTWNIVEDDAENCVRVYGKPYFKVYGGDVRVGSAVAPRGECSNVTSTVASIHAWNTRRDSAVFNGASSQHAAIAIGRIDQFVSGKSLVGNDNARYRTFANTDDSEPYGGRFADTVGDGSCASFAYQSTPAAPATIPGKPAFTGRVTEYATGDVYISDNIVYQNASGVWSSTQQIPNYRLIVKGGNIYIHNQVRQLDGTFIAVPDPNLPGEDKKGNIYTCAKDGVRAPVRQTFNDCKQPLIVNGALIAKRIHLQRDCGTVLKGRSQEPVQFSPLTSFGQTCLSGQDANGVSTINAAAEIINFSPESWISSAGELGDEPITSITSLPPVL